MREPEDILEKPMPVSMVSFNNVHFGGIKNGNLEDVFEIFFTGKIYRSMSERRYLETRNFSYELSKIKVELIRIGFYK